MTDKKHWQKEMKDWEAKSRKKVAERKIRIDQAKKMATVEFRQSMKKPGAIDKYAGQALERDRSERIREKNRKQMNSLQKQLEYEYEGMQREAKELGEPLPGGLTVKSIMGKKYRQKINKGGYVKKYAKGGGVRAVRS